MVNVIPNILLGLAVCVVVLVSGAAFVGVFLLGWTVDRETTWLGRALYGYAHVVVVLSFLTVAWCVAAYMLQ